MTTLSVPADILIGDTLNFSVGFTNSSPTTTGYGPYVDLVLPKTGDGGTAAPDGISFNSATYLGASLTATVLTFDALGHATHPYAKTNTGAAVVVNGTPGDQLVVLQLPFGSFTPGQPAANINVSATVSNLADVGVAQNITARGGFEYGNDALDNPTTDPSTIGTTATSTVTPELFIVTKKYIGPEDETATGPNFPRQDLISVEVAPGQTITNLDVTDVLPSNMQYVGVDSTAIRGTSTSTTSRSTPSASIPGGTLTRRFASVTGTGAVNDATLLYTYYIPLNDAASNPVIDPNTGAATTSTDSASAKGNWTPLNPADAPVTGITSSTATHVLNDRSIATQKSVAVVNDTGAPGPSPGDTLEYTINFQVSDFFAFENLILSDIISDGQHFDPSFTPTLQVNGNLFTLPTANFNGSNFSVIGNYTGATPPPTNPDGTSTVAFQISNELISRGQDGTLLGGMVRPGGGSLLTAPGDGPTTGTIVFRTIIQNQFTNNFPSGEANVDHGDQLTDNVTVQGDVLSTSTLAPTGSTVTDTSSASVTIVSGNLTKSIYAVNGNTSFTSPVKIAAGDTVTYRIQYTLPLSDEEQLAISDYLPLPIFSATMVSSFDDVGYSGSVAVIPTSGHANFGPNDTFRPLSDTVPTLTTDGTANSLQFAYPDYKDPGNTSTAIDLLFTVTASNLPFADGLFLTNQAHSVEGTTNGTPTTHDAIVQLQMTEPVLNITKGVVATDNPNAVISGTVGPVSFSAPGSVGYRGSSTINSNGITAHPITAGITKIDAGDRVTFAIVVQNTGSGLHGAFNVQLKDALPAGFAIPAGGLNLTATDGTGATMNVIDLGGGLFGAGLELSDPGPSADPTGALDPYDLTNGRNILVLTYDLQATTAVTPKENLNNTATLFNYASQSGGPDFLTTPLTATAPVTTSDVAVTKSLTTTDQGFTSGSNLAIGEVATYSVTMTVPEGTTPAAKLVDTLPAGMALYSLDTLTASSGALSFENGTLANILAAASVGTGGSSINLDFGTITNTDTNNSTAETITLVYRAVALNVASNTNNASLTNTAAFDYTGGSATATAKANVALPVLQVVKTIDNPHAQAGDVVTYTLVISHTAASRADAFDLTLTDVIPSDLTYESATLTNIAGLSPDSLSINGSTISATFGTFTKSDTCTISFQAVVGGGVAGLKPVTNTADLSYSTLPGSPGQISIYNTNSYERTGNTADPGGSVNNLDTQGSVSFTPPLSVSKTILGTNQAFTTGNNVAIGERIQYQVSMVISQGTTPGATLVDTLPSGLAILSLDSISASSSVSTSVNGGFAGVLSNAAVGTNGSSASFNFGTLTNTDADSGTSETIVVTYTVVVLNVAGNQNGVQLTNSATFTVPDGSSTASAPSVTVVTPALMVTETPSIATGDAGGPPITFTVVVSHTGTSTADAFDVNLSNLVPSGFILVPSTFTNSAGTVPATITQSGNNLTATYTTLPLGATSTLTFQATLNASTSPGQVLTDHPNITYTSLPGVVTTPESSYNTVSTERTGNSTDPGGSANTLTASATASVTLNVNSISGFVYSDANNDGTKQAGDSGISGVTVNLGGVDNLGNVVTMTTTTSGTGAYFFNNLRPGTYTVSEIQPASYLDGKDSLGTPFGGSASMNDVFSALVIPLGTNAAGANYNFGELSPASVAATIFRDGNNDGLKNGSDTGISGVTLTLTGLDDLGDSINTSATTNPSGNLSFSNLRPGTYTLVETQPSAYLDGKDSAGTTGGTLFNDQVANFTLSAGQSASGVTFGELAPSSLSGVVFHDANDDGTKQAGESGIDGVIVRLTGTDDLGNSVNTITTTSGGGLYSFTNLRPSNGTGYTITETQPTGFLDGKDTIGTPGAVATVNDVFSGIVLNPGIVGANNNFGELIPSSLAGYVYEDVNNDGTKQIADTGIGGVTITLSGTDDLGNTINQVVSTSGAGGYNFTGLRPGTYAITETQPTIYVDGKDTAGTPGGSTSTKNAISAIALGSGINGIDNNFSEQVTADLSLTKTVNDATPNAGENITFSLTIHNAGPDNATNVAVSDVLPAGLSFVSSSASQGNYSSGTGLWTVGTLASGATQTLTITATVGSSTPLTNTAIIAASDQADLTTTDWTAAALETPRLTDLGLTQSVSNPTPNVGDVIAFTTVLTNHGPDTATGIAVSIPIPSGLSFVSVAPGQGGFNSASGLWTVGTLSSGSSVVLVVNLQVNDPNPKSDTATISAHDQYDTNPSNDTASATETPRLADLVLTKVVDNLTPNVGDTITFTVTLTNNGPDSANGITVQDLVPLPLLVTATTPNQGTYDANSGLWTVGTVATGVSVSITFKATVVTPNPVSNTATVVSSDTYDLNSANNSATATETPQQADLSLSKSVSNVTPNVGDVITYVVTLTNNGPDAATHVTLNDLLPTGVSLVSAAPSLGTYDHATGIWTVGTIATNTSQTLTVNATVTSPGSATNTVWVGHSDQYDPDPANNTASVSETPQQAELGVTETIDNATPNVGDVISFTISLTNHGPDTASNLTLNDALPPGLTFQSATPAQGSYDANTNTWTVGSLASNGSTTLIIHALVVSPNTQTNPVEISHADQYDPIVENNQATESETPKHADLVVMKTVDHSSPNVGDNVTFTVTVTNNGPDDATGVALTDALPSGLAFVSYNASQGVYNNATGIWIIGTLTNGGSQTMTVVAKVVSPNPLTNTATITADDVYDPDLSNDASSVVETPQLADLVVTKSVDNTTPNVGDVITFTLTAANNGPDTGTHVVINDLLPAGLTFVSSTASQGSYDSNLGNWTLGTIGASGLSTLTISARVSSPNPLTNVASVTASDQYDPNSANNTSSVTEDPQIADLAVSKSVDKPTPKVGDTITFTVVLTNHGLDVATHVSISDALPAGMTYLSSSPTQGTYDSATGIWLVGSITSQGTATLLVTATVVSPNPLTNTASVLASDQYDPNTANNSATATETPQQSDLGVTTSVNDPHPNLGDLITFTIQIKNNGTDAATNVGLNNALPSGLSYVSSSTSQGTFDSTSGVWSLVSLNVSGSATLTISALVTSPLSQSLSASIVHSDQYDPVTANNASTVGELPQIADLVVTKTVDNASPNVGDVINFTVTIASAGPDAGTNVAVSDPLPAGLSFVNAITSQGTYDQFTGLWTVGRVSGPVTLTISARVVSPSALTNLAWIAHSDQYDPVSENNSASVTETPQIADLSLTETVDNPSPRLGSLVTFTVNIINNGSDSATHVTVSDLLPPGLTFVSAAPGQGTYDTSTGIWSVGTLPNQGSDTLTITATVSGSGIKTNLAQVSASDQYDPNSTPNNSKPAEDDQAGVDVTPLSSLSGSVFVDFNNDGVRQQGEAGISGVTLNLSGTDDQNQPVTLATLTGSDGGYLFDNLRPGTYTVTETQPAAYNDGIDTVGTAGGTLGNDAVSAISLGAGVVSNGYLFGELGASLSGTVFIDANQDGLLNQGESGLSGVTLTLKDVGGNVVATAVSGVDGTYHFDNLPATSYTLLSSPPSGYGQSTPVTLNPTLPLTGLSGQDFGETTASLSGHVYVDANNDGVFQVSESGLGGSTVTLTGTDALGSPVSRQATTLSDGTYSFPGLLSGIYTLTLTPPSGYLDGKRTIGTPGGTTAAEAFTGNQLGGGVLGVNNNFGELIPASLGGFVYHDSNDDGVKQPTETPSASVVLTLTGTDDLGQPVTTTTTTGSDGSYTFNNLRPGDYAVTATLPTDELGGKNSVGSQGGVARPNALTDLVLVSATIGINNNFALIDPVALGGSVFFDNNDDGVRQSSEQGIQAVSITLTGTDDNGQSVHVVASTDSGGFYQFPGLRPGIYSVTETQPIGYVDGKDAVGTAGGTLGNDVVTTISMAAGQVAVGYTFGEQGSTLSGVVTIDTKPVASAVVRLYNTSGDLVATTTTGPDGTYEIHNLPAGSFVVSFDAVKPDGIHATTSRPTTLSPGAVADESLHLNLSNGSLSGTIYLDDQHNGVRDPNEYGVANVTVTLTGVDNQGNAISRTTTTDLNGVYTFSNLPTGIYTLNANGPRTFIDGAGHPGTLGGTPGKDTITNISLQSGEQGTGYDFGKIARPECRLRCVEFHAALREGPLPNGGLAHSGRKGVTYKPIPVIRYWLPTLAARFGFTPGGVPGVRASAQVKGHPVISSAVRALVTRVVRGR